VIVRWGLDELPGLLDEVGVDRPLLVAGPRWDELGIPATHRWTEVPSDRIVVPAEVDGILAVGGGSAIDTAKAASAASSLPLVSVPTTYSGAEWTGFFGIRTLDRRQVGGGKGARPVGIVYDVDLTLDLPRADSAGTAMNALAHCVEALYPGELEVARRGAAGIDWWLPRVLEDGHDREARQGLLAAAADAGQALAERGLYLGHAMAQAAGGTYGLPHGAMNALCLPPAMRFNAETVPNAMTAVPLERVEQLARLGGFERLRDFGIRAEELDELGEKAAERPGAKANPRPATGHEVAELYRSIW
jgi:maleylacetate reductase